MAEKYDIAKLLTISTAHITDKTNALLAIEWNTNRLGLAVFSKRDYGYFIYIDEESKEKALNNDDSLPEDLRACIKLAVENECDWLCLDCDADEVDGLAKYEW